MGEATPCCRPLRVAKHRIQEDLLGAAGSTPARLIMEEKMTICPGIVLQDGRTIYPTGAEWILAFAIAGCQWAIDEIESGRLAAKQAELWRGDGI